MQSNCIWALVSQHSWRYLSCVFFSVCVCILYFCSRCTQRRESHEWKSNSWWLFVLAWVLSAMCCAAAIGLNLWLAYRPSLLASACSCKLVCNQICVLLRCFFSVNGSHRKYLEELHMIQFVFFFPRDDMELSSMCGTRTWKGKSVVKKLEMQTAAKWRSSFSRLNCR